MAGWGRGKPPISTTGSTPSVGTPSVAIGATSKRRNPPKNAPGQRQDIGWLHGTQIEGNKIKCKYCHKVISSGGIYRLKHHLACTKKDVEECRAVPDDVREQMWNLVVEMQKKLIDKRIPSQSDEVEVEEIGGGKRRLVEVRQPNISNIFKKGITQPTINSVFKQKEKDELDLQIATYFYDNCIAFNVSRNDEWRKVVKGISRYGNGYEPPSYHDISNKLLKKKVEQTNLIREEHRVYWKKFGCSIMTDGWTDQRKRTLLNFCVHCPRGTFFLKSIDASGISKTADKILEMMEEVVDEVGQENVVQIVTDNAANYKLAGEMLMQKRPCIYWTPCAAHCIDLMLEDFESKLPLHKVTIAKGKKITRFIYARAGLVNLLHHFTGGGELVRHGATRFATSYLSLGSLNENRGALVQLFTSRQWSGSQFAKLAAGKEVADIVLDKMFWKNLITCIKGAFPLLKVLRMVDSDDRPAMAYIYESMDQCKEQIQEAFKDNRKSYMPLWKIIDSRWDKQLHRPLHAAAHYLNPKLHYQPNFTPDEEVKNGMYACLKRMLNYDYEKIGIVDTQLEIFKARKGLFGDEIALRALNTKTPAQWWESYGSSTPLLQWFAMRVLNLTCSSSGCERNWSAFDMVHSKKRNRLLSSKLNDLVYVMVNGRLTKERNERRKRSLEIDDIDDDDDWFFGQDEEENGANIVDLDEDLIGNDNVGSNSATNGAPVDELDVVDDGGDDGGEGEGDDGGEGEGDDEVNYEGDDYEGTDYGAYEVVDEINEDEDEDIMGDMPNINVTDLI